MKCSCCQNDLPDKAFPKDGYGKRRNTCKSCYNGNERTRSERRRNQAFNRLVGWKAALLLTIVTGIFQYDSVSGKNRMCVYQSIYGYHTVTIDALQMCPLTWDFDV